MDLDSKALDLEGFISGTKEGRKERNSDDKRMSLLCHGLAYVARLLDPKLRHQKTYDWLDLQ